MESLVRLVSQELMSSSGKADSGFSLAWWTFAGIMLYRLVCRRDRLAIFP